MTTNSTTTDSTVNFDLLEEQFSRDKNQLGEEYVNEKYADPNASVTQYDLRNNVIERLGGYEGIAYSGKTFRLYENGIWPDVNELEVEREVSREISAAHLHRRVEPTNGLTKSVASLMRSATYVREDRWNALPNILVLRNHALDTDAMRVIDHSPNHRATLSLPYDYDGEAEAQTWEKVLKDLLTEEESRFFQEYAGYCLTHSVKHQMALWLVGPRGGGKSTLITGLEAMLGDLAGVLSPSKLSKQFGLSGIVGKTLLTCTEVPKGHMKATEILNALITGDTAEVEQKYKNSFKYRNTAKLMWSMNSLPGLYDANNGIFRRAKVLEIGKAIPDAERDPDVIERVQSEGPGILNWALEGLAWLNDRGQFDYPRSVIEATERFKKDNDLQGQFLEERCELPQDRLFETKEYRVHASKLASAFNEWLKSNHYQGQWSVNSLAREWRRLGLKEGGKDGLPERDSGGKLWYGVKLV